MKISNINDLKNIKDEFIKSVVSKQIKNIYSNLKLNLNDNIPEDINIIISSDSIKNIDLENVLDFECIYMNDKKVYYYSYVINNDSYCFYSESIDEKINMNPRYIDFNKSFKLESLL